MLPNLRNLLMLAFITTCFAALTQPVQPVRTMDIPFVYQSPDIDAQDDESGWSISQSTTIFNPTGHDGDADFSGSFKVMWSYQYLYFFAVISDDIEHNYSWGVGNPWEFDNCEIFIDLDTNTIETAYRNNSTVQLRFCRGLDSVETPGRASRLEYEYYWENTASGWNFEAAIPWTCAMAEGMLPEDIEDYLCNSIGFDVAFADSDNLDGDPATGNRDVQSAWDMDEPDTDDDRTEDSAWNNTSVFGYINLLFCADAIEYEVAGNTTMIVYSGTEEIRVSGCTPGSQLMLYSAAGQLLNTFIAEQAEITIDIGKYNPGVYFLVDLKGNTAKFLK